MNIKIPNVFKRILITLLVFISIAYIYDRYISKTYKYSVQSPDNKYCLEVYYENRFFAMPGDGGLCGTPTYFKLLNEYGFEIGHSNTDCFVFACDIEVEWNYDENRVSFAKARYIDLTTGNCCE